MVDISPQKDGGVLKEIVREGVGEAVVPRGSTVWVHYTGTLLDGTEFDSSRKRNQPFEFALGKGVVIKAWDIGVASMKKGERAILTCAPEYAYGQQGSPPTIPANATLKFDVEVIEWKGEDLSPKKDGGIERVIITPGTGYTNPTDGSTLTVHLEGKFEDRIFDERDVTFALGEGETENIIEGVEKALEHFNKGEMSRLTIAPKYAFGAEGNAAFGVPPNATVEYTVTLKVFEKMKENWSMDTTELIEQAKLSKEKGTTYFKAERYALAIKFYQKIITYLKDVTVDDELKEEVNTLRLSANLNLSLCYLKSGNNFEARNAATAALEFDPNNAKAHFRRGQALLNLKEPELAAKEFAQVLQLEPTNQAAKNQQQICSKILKDQLKREKQIYANMFDKFAKTDTQKEEEEKRKLPDVMSSLGEWGIEDRHREPSEFEKENPNILLLNGSGEFKDM